MKKFYTLLVVAFVAVNGAMAQSAILDSGMTVYIELQDTTAHKTSSAFSISPLGTASNVAPELATLRSIPEIKVNQELDNLITLGLDPDAVTKIIFGGSNQFCYFDFQVVDMLFPNKLEMDFTNAPLTNRSFSTIWWYGGSQLIYNKTDGNNIGPFQTGSKKLTTVRFNPNSDLKNLGLKTFALCPKLNDITLPGNIEILSSNCFLECQALLRVDIPASLKSVSEQAFTSWGLASTRHFYFESTTPPTFATNAFSGNTSYKIIMHVPDAAGAKEAYEASIATNGGKARITVLADVATSINEADADVVSVYPNPTVNIVTVKGLDGTLKQVYDTAGRLILQTEENSFDLSGQAQGIYFVKAGDTTLKVIKN